MIYLNTDKEGYLLSVAETAIHADAPEADTLDGFDLAGVRLQAHRWDGEKLVLDKARLAALEAGEKREKTSAEIRALRAKLAATDGEVLAALEGLLAAKTATALVAAIAEAANKLKDTLAERNGIRAEIAALEAAE